jgi:tetratricopeptide (TPR) repeat protein
MIAMGIYYYQFVDSSPDIVVPQRQIAIKTTPVVLPETQQQPLVAEEVLAEEEDDQVLGNTMQDDAAPVETNVFTENKTDLLSTTKASEVADVENTLEPNEVLARSSADLEETSFVQTKKIIVSESASIQVIKIQKKPRINPVLMRAYSAYQVGNDHEARSSYKEVLRTDGLNVDAMLGLGAIATRQGRIADANDWYQRVLRLEPRNDTAKTALLYSQAQRNPQIGDESHIKSMIAQSPNDSSLYAALGDFYIKQNQWPAAQQAYFDAYRLNSSADNAFNLAVSLDQMAKPKLALPYYQQALEKAEQSQNTSIDMAALQARIHSIQ